jgi:S-adenosylmethionine:tRNA ribosyltransferase-isomerase
MKPFDYQLPADRIAQRPVYPYHNAKLLVVNRVDGRMTESTFWDLEQWLTPADTLVLNNTRVIPSRMFAENPDSGGRLELLLLSEEGEGQWRGIGKPMKKIRPEIFYRVISDLGSSLCFRAERDSAKDELRISFFINDRLATREEVLAHGLMPIPPYIRGGKSDEQDNKDYQSSFAAHEGSVAAPTAGLHFTPELVAKLKERGNEFLYTTLHVGAASFQSLWTDHAQEVPNSPATELCEFSPQLIEHIQGKRQAQKRVIAVGTTVVRSLESMARDKNLGGADHFLRPTDLFIQPGFQFQMLDAVITNFHQPRTTHMLLVEALLGRDLLEESYAYALEHDFRFLSYGDGMLIL